MTYARSKTVQVMVDRGRIAALRPRRRSNPRRLSPEQFAATHVLEEV